MKRLFTKPYPFLYSAKRSFIIAIGISLFIGGLNFYLSDQQSIQELLTISKTTLAILFGLITFGVIIIFLGLIPNFFFSEEIKENWTIGKETILIVALLTTIIILNYILLLIVAQDAGNFLSINHFLLVGLNGLIFGIVPTSFMNWLNYTIILRKNLRQVKLYNKQLQKMLATSVPSSQEKEIELSPANSKDTIKVLLSQVLFIKSEGNYIEIYQKVNQKITKDIHRASLQTIENHLADFPHIVRTHRSYIVNIKNIKETKGNARNYQLFFEHTNLSVPVSRSKFQAFHQKLTAQS